MSSPNRNEIIYNLYTGKNFADCLSKMEPYELREDLKQEVIAIICELPDEKLFELYRNKILDFYTVKIILNQIKSSTSPFFKKYRQFFEPLESVLSSETGETIFERVQCQSWLNEIDLEERKNKEDIEDEITDMVQSIPMQLTDIRLIDEKWKLNQYEQILLKMYYLIGNFRDMEKETGIPWESCYKTVKNALKKIHKNIKSKKEKLYQ